MSQAGLPMAHAQAARKWASSMDGRLPGVPGFAAVKPRSRLNSNTSYSVILYRFHVGVEGLGDPCRIEHNFTFLSGGPETYHHVTQGHVALRPQLDEVIRVADFLAFGSHALVILSHA